MSKVMKKTRYAELKSVQMMSEESMGQIQAKTADLKLHADALANIHKNRVKAEGMKRPVRRAAKDLVVKQVEPMMSIINAIHKNLDPQFQAKLEKTFIKDKKFAEAMKSYMKGHDNKEITTFLGQLSNIVAQQDEARKVEVAQLMSAKAEADKKLNNPIIRFFLKLAHYLTPKHMSPEQVVEQKKAAKALVSRKGGSEVDSKKSEATVKEKSAKVDATAFAKTKPKVRFFDKLRHPVSEKAAGKSLSM